MEKKAILSEWKKKKLASSIWCLQEAQYKYKGKDNLKVKRWEKVYCTTANQKKAGVSILITEKAVFKSKGNYQRQTY